jgi:hypothetical protein
VNNEVEGMWKEAIVGYFKTLARNLLRGTKEKREKPLLVYFLYFFLSLHPLACIQLLCTNFHRQRNNCFILLVYIKHYMFRPQRVILRCYRFFGNNYQTVTFTFTICIHVVLKRSPSRLWLTKIMCN